MAKKLISLLVLLVWLLAACAQNPGEATTAPTQASPAKTTAQNEVPAAASQANAQQSLCTVVSRSPTPGPTEEALIPPVSEKDWTKGSPAAYITILEYSDFM